MRSGSTSVFTPIGKPQWIRRAVGAVGQPEAVGFCSPASAASNASASASNASASRKRASAFPFRFAARSRSLSGSGTCRFRTSPGLHRMRPVSSNVPRNSKAENEGPPKRAGLKSTAQQPITSSQRRNQANRCWVIPVLERYLRGMEFRVGARMFLRHLGAFA